MPQMSQVLRELAIGMLTAGMSTRAVARELYVHFSTIGRLQRRFREFGSTSNRPHNCRHNIYLTYKHNIFLKYIHVCVCIYTDTINIHSTHTYKL